MSDENVSQNHTTSINHDDGKQQKIFLPIIFVQARPVSFVRTSSDLIIILMRSDMLMKEKYNIFSYKQRTFLTYIQRHTLVTNTLNVFKKYLEEISLFSKRMKRNICEELHCFTDFINRLRVMFQRKQLLSYINGFTLISAETFNLW